MELSLNALMNCFCHLRGATLQKWQERSVKNLPFHSEPFVPQENQTYCVCIKAIKYMAQMCSYFLTAFFSWDVSHHWHETQQFPQIFLVPNSENKSSKNEKKEITEKQHSKQNKKNP